MFIDKTLEFGMLRMQSSTYKQVDENIDASMYYVTDDLGVKRGVWITRVGAGDLEVWYGMVWYGMVWYVVASHSPLYRG